MPTGLARAPHVVQNKYHIEAVGVGGDDGLALLRLYHAKLQPG